MKLYFSPGSISLAVHIVLRELSIPFDLAPTPTGEEAHQSAAYLALNPLGRVPTLVDGDTVVTETAVILRWLALQSPDSELYPVEENAALRCDEVLSQLSTIAHPAYRMTVRPDRVAGAEHNEATFETLRAAGLETFLATIGAVESRLPDAGWSLGAKMSILDPYLAVMWLWVRYARADPADFPRLSRIALAVLGRESAVAAILAEGLVDETGRPTPPSRV